MFQYAPRKMVVPWVVAGRPLGEHLFRLSLRNVGDQRARPVFVTPGPYVTVGPSPNDVESVPRALPGQREMWRAAQPLEPRATRDFLVFLDPLSPSLPRAGSRKVNAQIEIHSEVDGQSASVGAVPIVLDEIRGAPPAFRGVAAVDFGTTNTCIVLSPSDRWEPEILFSEGGDVGGGGETPTLVAYLDVEDAQQPRYVIGREARLRIGNLGGDDVISSVKRYVGSEKRFLVGSSSVGELVYYRPNEVATHFLKKLKGLLETFLRDRAVTEMVCTYPTAFNKSQQDALAEVFAEVQAGMRETYGDVVKPFRMFLDEATAAAIFHMQREFGDLSVLRGRVEGNEFSILCYDLGGGTTDVSLTRFTLENVSSAHGTGRDVALEEIDEFLELDPEEEARRDVGEAPAPVVHGRVVGRDGLHFFGGDNMSLAVYRILKARYALLLAKHVLDTTMPDAKDPRREASLQVLGASDLIQTWLAAGNPVGADASVGFPGHKGAEVPASVWDPIDVLVPTRWHIDYDFKGPERDARHQIFYDLWQSAEAAKVGFGTPGADGEHPKSVEVPPPPALLDRYGIGPHKLRCVLLEHEVKPHLAPHLVLGLKRAGAVVKEAGLEKVSFFILAGNACKLPLVRQLFHEHMAAVGAGEANVFFDPKVAKTSVASGACLLAVFEQLRSGVQWRFEAEEDTLTDFIGTMAATAVFAASADRFVSWFHQGQPLPAHAHVRVNTDAASLRVVAFRRLGGEPQQYGSFLFREIGARCGWDELPDDLAAAVAQFGLAPGDPVEAGGEVLADVLMTSKRKLYLQKGDEWFALWPVRSAPPPMQDPFSGRQ